MTELTYGEDGWRRKLDTERHHRENLWDYKGRAVYHITLATEQRQPLFGELVGDSEEEAFVIFSDLGHYLCRSIIGLPDFFLQKQIKLKVLAFTIMPDHLHMIIQVLEPMPRSIGEVVRSFKSAATSYYKKHYYSQQSSGLSPFEPPSSQRLSGLSPLEPPSSQQPSGLSPFEKPRPIEEPQAKLSERLVQFCRIFATRGSIWEYLPAGYHERILHCEGQLDRMIKYVIDNPRRLWLKRHNAHLFKMKHNLPLIWNAQDGTTHRWIFRAMGNLFLCDFPLRLYLQCSRKATKEELANLMETTLTKARQGYVTITAAISEGEKIIARKVRESGFPLVILMKDGFPQEGSPKEKYYKPGGVYFDACANGKLLLLEPEKAVMEDRAIAEAVHQKAPGVPIDTLRYQFLGLNFIAKVMAERGWKHKV